MIGFAFCFYHSAATAMKRPAEYPTGLLIQSLRKDGPARGEMLSHRAPYYDSVSSWGWSLESRSRRQAFLRTNLGTS